MWIDANGVYYGWYRQAWNDRRIFTKPFKAPFDAVYARRCASCHQGGEGLRHIRYPSVDHRNPEQSRALLAPLAAAAGGWGACGESVFKNREDPDYAPLAAGVRALAAELKQRPRRDLEDLTEPDPALQTARADARQLPEHPRAANP